MSMYAAVIMGGLEVLGTIHQSEITRGQIEVSNQLRELNAKYAEMDALEVEAFGKTQASRYEQVVNETIATQKAIFAGQGVDFSTGTAAEIMEDTRIAGFLNRLDIERAARSKAMGIRLEARDYRLGGHLQRYAAEAQMVLNERGAALDAIGGVVKNWNMDGADKSSKTKKRKSSTGYSGGTIGHTPGPMTEEEELRFLGY